MDIKVLGIDLGKTVCSLAGLDEAGAVVFRKRLQWHRLLDFLSTLPPCAARCPSAIAILARFASSLQRRRRSAPSTSPRMRPTSKIRH